jgi:peptide deformylase
MAILKVARLGHPILRQVATALTAEQIESTAFQQLCDDMLDTLYDYDGAGLAAPQVHESVRVVVLELPGENGPEFFVNPKITPLSDEQASSWEGCLSVPEMRGLVQRSAHVRIEALDRQGRPKAYELGGFPAVVVQHECDHLDGVLYVDKADPRSLAFVEEYRRYGPCVEVDEDAYDDDMDDLDDLDLEA